MKTQIIKIGFDMDGVLLYNPARIFRPIIAFIKKHITKRDLSKFYYPKTKIESFIWTLLHKSSLWPAPGINNIQQLIKHKKIKAYIISARYESLKTDFNSWIKQVDPNKHFSGYYYNDKNEQPYEFKTRIIKKLKLDMFVEDNWDIVKQLNKQNKHTKIFWIYNLLDRNIMYQYKFSSLKQVVNQLFKKSKEY